MVATVVLGHRALVEGFWAARKQFSVWPSGHAAKSRSLKSTVTSCNQCVEQNESPSRLLLFWTSSIVFLMGKDRRFPTQRSLPTGYFPPWISIPSQVPKPRPQNWRRDGVHELSGDVLKTFASLGSTERSFLGALCALRNKSSTSPKSYRYYRFLHS